MKISFYEEFPTKENLNKLKLINFQTKIIIATKSLKEFEIIKKKTKKINKKITCVYWPILKNSYWISPFSNTSDLIKSFKELKKTKNPILIDLEYPILNKKLFLKNLIHFKKNKRIIKKFLKENHKKIITAQFPLYTGSKIKRVLGLDYPIKIEKSLMWYSSMIPESINKKLKKQLKKLKNKENYSISLGTIAKGILKNEPILSPKNLKKDLNFVKKAGFNKVIIFRLGGLNKKYIEIINKFQK